MANKRKSLLTVVALAALAAVRADITTVVGARAAKPAKLHQPAGVATLLRDGKLHTWVADTQNNRVQYVNEAGDVETVAGTGDFDFFGDGGDAVSAKLAWPHGVAVRDTCRTTAAAPAPPHSDDDEELEAGVVLYIADTYNHRVRRVVDGRIETVAGNGKRGFRGDGGAATSARLSHPHAVAVLPADCAGWGATASSAGGGQAATPTSGYTIWIADTYNNRVRRIDADGIIATVAGTGAANFAGDNGAALDASLAWPMGLTVLPSVRTPGSVVMVIADTYNHRVRVVNGAGIITTLAGNGKEGFSQDGPDARQEALSHPFGIAAVRTDPKLDVFVVWFTDSSGHKLRQIGPNRALYTLAGKTWPGYRGDNGPAYDAVLNQPKGLALVPNAATAAAAAGGNDDTVHLLFADCYNHAVRQVDASLSAPAVDPRSVHLQLAQQKEMLARKLLNGGTTPTADVSATHTPTPSSSSTADVSSTHTPTPSSTFTADVSSTHTPTPSSSSTADVSSTHTPTPSWTRTATRSPSASVSAFGTPSGTRSPTTTVSALSTPSGTPSVSLSITPVASASAAPSVAPGSTVVSTIIRLNNVDVPCDVLARDVLFVSLLRLSFAVALDVSLDRVHVDVVVDGNCSSTIPLRRQLQSGGSAPVNVNVGIVTSPTQTDANTIDASAVENTINQTPVAVLLQTFLGSGLATALGITPSSVEITSPAAISTTPAPPEDNGLSGGAIAGIVVGSVAFVAIVGLLVTLAVMRHHSRTSVTSGGDQGAHDVAPRQQRVQPHTALEMPAAMATAPPPPVQPGAVVHL